MQAARQQTGCAGGRIGNVQDLDRIKMALILAIKVFVFGSDITNARFKLLELIGSGSVAGCPIAFFGSDQQPE